MHSISVTLIYYSFIYMIIKPIIFAKTILNETPYKRPYFSNGKN